MVRQLNDAGFWKMTGSAVASCPVSRVGPSRDGLGSAGTGWAPGLSVAWESIACCSSASVLGLRCVGPSVIDVSPQDLSHRSPAVGLAAAGRTHAAIDTPLRTKSGLNLFRAAALFFWRVQGLRYNLLPLLCESCLPAEFIHLCLFFWCRLGGDSGEKKYWRCLIYATYVSVFESQLLFNNTPDPLFPGAEEWKGTFFNCRGCNSTLSEPIVLQKLHLFFSWLVYRGCCSSGRQEQWCCF